MKNPCFSIIIPTFNSAATIEKCISSIISQRFGEYEILIMDGCSQDETLNAIEAIRDNRIKVFSEKDNGIYDAMNKGVKVSNGEWLYFLGSDDYLINEQVLTNIHSVIGEVNPDFLYGNVIWGNTNVVYRGEVTYKSLLADNICHQAIFIKKQLLYNYGLFDIRYPYFADWFLNLQIFRDKKINIKYINQVIAYYNTTGASATNLLRDQFNDYRTELSRAYYSKSTIARIRISQKLDLIVKSLVPKR